MKCAFYEKEITPPLGCHIPGYFNLRQGSGVKDRLFARAVAISDDDNTVILVSIDGCTCDNSYVDTIKARIVEFTGVPATNILVGYTHSHTAVPTIWHNTQKIATENSLAAQEGYHTVFSKLIADCGILAYRQLSECSPYFAKGEVCGISFCRDYFMKNSTPRTNPPRMSPEIIGPTAETDNELPILFFRDANDKPMGAVISFACHPDCVDGTEYSGDYISELSKQLKAAYGDEFVTVYLLGTCGDINHFDVSKPGDAPDHYRMMGRLMAEKAINAISNAQPLSSTKLTSKFEVLTLKRREISEEVIADARDAVATIKEIKGIKISADNTDPDQYRLVMSRSLLNFVDNTPEERDIPLQFISIGDFKLYAMPSEVYCYFGRYIKQRSETPKTMVTTLCNASFGYIPTRDLFFDTIYESRPGANTLEIEAGYIMVDKLLEMGR